MIISNQPNTNFAFLVVRVDDLQTLKVCILGTRSMLQAMYEGHYPKYRLDRLLEEVESTIESYIGGNK